MKVKLVFFLLLFVFDFFLFSFCSVRKPSSVREREALEGEIGSIGLKEKLSRGESLIDAIKDPSLLPGYNVVSYEYLDQDSLYKKINGAADSYISDHGFRGCAYVELTSKLSNALFIIYVYDMGFSLNAFGIYSSERSPSYNFVDIDMGAYEEGNSLVFWKSRYYIKIELQSSSEGVRELLFSLARRLSSVLVDSSNVLEFARHFPRDGRVDNSLRYYHANFDAQPLFKSVYELGYSVSGVDASMFLARFKDRASLDAGLVEYRDFLSIASFRRVDNLYIGKDGLEDRLCIFAIEGNYLVGAFNFSEEEGREKIYSLISSLRRG